MKGGWKVGWYSSPSSCLSIIFRLSLSPPNSLIDSRSNEWLIPNITQKQFKSYFMLLNMCCTALILRYSVVFFLPKIVVIVYVSYRLVTRFLCFSSFLCYHGWFYLLLCRIQILWIFCGRRWFFLPVTHLWKIQGFSPIGLLG